MLENTQELKDLENTENLKLLCLVKYPNYIRSKAEPIKHFKTKNDSYIYDEFIKNMFYTMERHGAIAISAPQVNVNKQIIICNYENPLIIMNPVLISHSSTKTEFEEGLLAIIGFFYKMKRYDSITIAYQDEEGEHKQLYATGLLSAIIQHELDILNGKIYLDKLSPIKKLLEIKKIKKFLKAKHESY